MVTSPAMEANNASIKTSTARENRKTLMQNSREQVVLQLFQSGVWPVPKESAHTPAASAMAGACQQLIRTRGVGNHKTNASSGGDSEWKYSVSVVQCQLIRPRLRHKVLALHKAHAG
jgi:hypothetical protein